MLMAKVSRQHFVDVDVRSIVIIILAIAIGFLGGEFYSNHVAKSSSSSLNVVSPTTVCNCPNIPVGSNPEKICKC